MLDIWVAIATLVLGLYFLLLSADNWKGILLLLITGMLILTGGIYLTNTYIFPEKIYEEN